MKIVPHSCIRVLLCAAFSLFLGNALSQYSVMRVAGKVSTTGAGSLRPGTPLNPDDELIFQTADTRLYVLLKGEGSFVLTPRSAGRQTVGSLNKTAIRKTLTRAALIQPIPNEFEGKLLIENENKFLFDRNAYPAGGAFFLEADVTGHAPEIRVLETRGDTLVLHYLDFLVDANPQDTKYQIGFSVNGQSRRVSGIDPEFDLADMVGNVVASTIALYKNDGMVKDAIVNEAWQSVLASVGRPAGLTFRELFERGWNPWPQEDHRYGLGAEADPAGRARTPKLTGSLGATRGEVPLFWTLRQYAPPIGNQGSMGTCVAWATAYAARTIAYAVQHGYSMNNNYEEVKTYSFSPEFVYNKIKRAGADCSQGTTIYDALQLMKNSGNLVNTPNVFVCSRTYGPADTAGARNYSIKDFLRIELQGGDPMRPVQQIKSLLLNKTAVPFIMHVSPGFYHIDRSGVFYPSAADEAELANVRRNQAVFRGHAMCIIGYNDNVNGGSFEVMNSWGDGWANQGFWWVNYQDFIRYAFDAYAINDFAAAPVVQPAIVVRVDDPLPSVRRSVNPGTVVRRQENVFVTPLVKVDPSSITTLRVSSPQLKGNLEFDVLNPDNTYEIIPANKKQVDTRGQVTESDREDPSLYANYVLARPMQSGTRYKIKFNLDQPAYVYVIGMDASSNYTLFPLVKNNESALIDVAGATLFLPTDSTHYKLDNNPGKEKMCVLVSKSPIDLEAINSSYASSRNLYTAVRSTLAGRLVEQKAVNFANRQINFDIKAGENDVLSFFIEMEHL